MLMFAFLSKKVLTRRAKGMEVTINAVRSSFDRLKELSHGREGGSER